PTQAAERARRVHEGTFGADAPETVGLSTARQVHVARCSGAVRLALLNRAAQSRHDRLELSLLGGQAVLRHPGIVGTALGRSRQPGLSSASRRRFSRSASRWARSMFCSESREITVE